MLGEQMHNWGSLIKVNHESFAVYKQSCTITTLVSRQNLLHNYFSLLSTNLKHDKNQKMVTVVVVMMKEEEEEKKEEKEEI